MMASELAQKLREFVDQNEDIEVMYEIEGEDVGVDDVELFRPDNGDDPYLVIV